MAHNGSGLGCPLKLWIISGCVGLIVVILSLLGGKEWLAAIFVGIVATGLLGLLLTWLICKSAGGVSRATPSEPLSDEEIKASAAPAAPVSQPAPVAEAKPEAKAAAEAPAEKAAPAAVAPAASATDETTAAADHGEGTKPQALAAARDGGADDLKKIKGVGPKLETMLNDLGFYHFDQIAGWTAAEVAWVDQNLKGFKGRVSRDAWVDQAKLLASGGETEFSKKVDKGGVY